MVSSIDITDTLNKWLWLLTIGTDEYKGCFGFIIETVFRWVVADSVFECPV